jgi:hypothetical protein
VGDDVAWLWADRMADAPPAADDRCLPLGLRP